MRGQKHQTRHQKHKDEETFLFSIMLIYVSRDSFISIIIM